MPGFNIGAFAGGVGSGIEQGQAIRAKQLALQLQQIQESAKTAYSNYLQQGGSPQEAASIIGGGAMGGAAPQSPPGGLTALSPQPGGGGAAGGGAPGRCQGGPGASPGAPPPSGGLPALSAPPAGATAPQVAPGPMTPPTPAPAPGPQPGPAAQPSGGAPAAQTDGGADLTPDKVAAQGKAAIQNVARDIAAANPGRKWKHGELLAAVEMALDDQKKYYDPIAISSAKAQLAFANAQLKHAEALERISTTQRGQDMTHEDRQDATAQREQASAWMHEDRDKAIEAALQRQNMADATRLQAEAIMQAGANGRTGEVTAQRDRALQAGMNLKEWQTQVQAQLKEQGMSDAYVSRIFSAEAGSAPAGAAPPAPARPSPQAGATPPRAAPVRIQNKEQAAKLKPGTHYMTPDGRELIR